MKTVFADILGKLRREKGLSQRRAAADLGISQALLSHYENDAREPKLEFVIKACDYYSVTADYILGRKKTREDKVAQLAEAVGEIVDSLDELKTAETDLISKLKKLAAKDKK